MRHDPPDEVALRHVRKPIGHDSADRHVSGTAPYIDDIREPDGTLHVVPGGAPVAHGRLRGLDLTRVLAAPGVVAVLTAADIPSINDVSPVAGDDPLFVADEVSFHGQPLFAVVAETRDAARRAARLAVVDIAEEPPLVTVADALAADADIMPAYAFRRGDPEAMLATGPTVLSGTLAIGGQEHFYLEGQVGARHPRASTATYVVHSSTQHPTEVQHVCRPACWACPSTTASTTMVRRLGGGFGGKESQAERLAAAMADAGGDRSPASPVKLRLAAR